MSFQSSPQQAHAMVKFHNWYRHERHQRQVFRLFGFAGTGKTTITRHAIGDLGLDPMDKASGRGNVLYAAFTGKAALVMTRNGTPASTIHSLIYKVWEATPEEIAAANEEELAQLRASLSGIGQAERKFAMAQVRQLEQRLADLRRPRFVLNEKSLLHDADLLVLDEVSMVGADMAADLLAFRKPILVLGDPGQLPPIRGEGAFTDTAPDVLLTEIHRQAEESAVLRLATMARKGEAIPFGEHDHFVWKMRRKDVPPEQMLNGGQVICGRNATRRVLNSAMKAAAGFPYAYPEGRGEKIICLKNRNDLGLVNGMFLALSDVRDEDDHSFSAVVRTEDGAAIPGRLHCYKGEFDDHVSYDPGRETRDGVLKRELIQTVWGWAITCHKAQGSQWQDVIVVDDGLARTAAEHARWLYTAITRAVRGLVLLA